MNIPFYKYQGAGNDFIMVDNREAGLLLTTEQINHCCDRRFGIGADGFILLEYCEGYDFRMVYYNADGNESTMCGNGGRCIALFARDLGIINTTGTFLAIDGPHEIHLESETSITIGMKDVANIEFGRGETILDTGSPHIVIPISNINAVNVVEQGRIIRYQVRFGDKGINVNFVEEQGDVIAIRTYERGVEDETLACGTGVTAAAISSVGNKTGAFEKRIKAVGGDLSVSFIKDTADSARDVTLTGPAQFVFKGTINI